MDVGQERCIVGGKGEKPKWNGEGEKPNNEESQEEEISLDDNDCYSSNECNDLHRAKDTCCYRSFDDNDRCTDEAPDWI